MNYYGTKEKIFSIGDVVTLDKIENKKFIIINIKFSMENMVILLSLYDSMDESFHEKRIKFIDLKSNKGSGMKYVRNILKNKFFLYEFI